MSATARKVQKKTTRLLIEEIQAECIQGFSLLDVGGGIGANRYALLASGAQSATDVVTSQAYLRAAREEAERRDLAEWVSFRTGNFVSGG